MGSSLLTVKQTTCSGSLLLLPWPIQPQQQAPLPMAPLTLFMPLPLWRSCPLSPMPMSMGWLMTTPRPTLRRLRPRTLKAESLAPSPSPSLTAVSRPPSTPLTITMALLLRSPTRAPLFTPLSPREGMAMLPLLWLPLLTSLHLSLLTSLEGSKKDMYLHIYSNIYQINLNCES